MLRSICAILLVFTVAAQAEVQTGLVRSGGQPIPGATVTAECGTDPKIPTTTDDAGRFEIGGLPATPCKYTVLMFGFEPLQKDAAAASTPLTFDLTLQGHATVPVAPKPVAPAAPVVTTAAPAAAPAPPPEAPAPTPDLPRPSLQPRLRRPRAALDAPAAALAARPAQRAPMPVTDAARRRAVAEQAASRISVSFKVRTPLPHRMRLRLLSAGVKRALTHRAMPSP